MPKHIWILATAQEFATLGRVLARYGLTITMLFRNSIANTNQVYLAIIQLFGLRLIIRVVNPETYGVVSEKERHIALEVEALKYLADKNFSLSPRVVRNLAGADFTSIDGIHYMLFSEMPGRPVAGFDDLEALTPSRRNSLFEGVGRMSRLLRSAVPVTQVRESTLVEHCSRAHLRLDQIEEWLTKKEGFPNEGLQWLRSWRNVLDRFIADTCAQLSRAGYEQQPKQLVHGDLHGGNFLFVGNELSAILDFDWLAMDCRITDLASVLFMCCYNYGGANDGMFDKDLLLQGLKSFRQGFGESEYLAREERDLLIAGIKGYAIFQLLFTADFYARHPTRRNFYDLQHFTRTVVSNNFEALLAEA